ncbi:glutathione synthase [Orobanche hederae]
MSLLNDLINLNLSEVTDKVIAEYICKVIQHDQGLTEEADNSMQEADQDYLDFGRSHGRIHKVLTA